MRRIGKTGQAGTDPPLYARTNPQWMSLENFFWEGGEEEDARVSRPALKKRFKSKGTNCFLTIYINC
jgi:hypothetical protein